MIQLRSFVEQLHYVPRAFKLVWSAARKWTIAWLVLLIVQSILPVVSVILTRTFINGIVGAVKTQWDAAQIQAVLVPFVLLVVLMLANRILNSVSAWVRTGQAELVRDYLSGIVQAQASRLDMAYYEQTDYYDLIHRVREQARYRPLTLLESSGMLLQSLLSMLGLAGLLVSYGALLLPLLILGALPALWSVVRFNLLMNHWRKASTPRERRAYYYDILLTERVSASEMRLFGLSDHYRAIYQALRTELRTERLRLWRSKIIIDLLVAIFSMAVAGAVMAWMGWRVFVGTATLGDLAALYQIFTSVQDALSTITARAGDVYESVLFLEDLFVFMDLQPYLVDRVTAHLGPLSQEIRFENVSFQYPGSDRAAVRDFSIVFPAGKIVALVGENGEGKTTLMKLLCRFFDPSDGHILWDGTDLRDVPVHELRRQITMLFQNPYYYPESAHNNIAVGDIDMDATREDIETAARAAAAHDMIMRLPQGYETVLGKWFGGEDLSIGQWQRLALARAFLREASLIILDEPTSAMDAWAEMDWLSRVREAARDRTLIMITHRFTTAMHADLIYVLHEQKVIEQGTHAELIASHGRYATSWHEQMREAQNTDELPLTPNDNAYQEAGSEAHI